MQQQGRRPLTALTLDSQSTESSYLNHRPHTAACFIPRGLPARVPGWHMPVCLAGWLAVPRCMRQYHHSTSGAFFCHALLIRQEES
jgi:hypothetical protein